LISVDDAGYTWEADPRHAEILARGLQKAVTTPRERTKADTRKLVSASFAAAAAGDDVRLADVLGKKFDDDPEDDENPLLDSERAFLYRSLTMRGAFLSLDRPDISYACKELARTMSAPRESCWQQLKRFGRYLLGFPRLVYRYAWSKPSTVLRVETDSDYAGCHLSRKSTSAYCMFWGKGWVKHSSKNQTTIATSTQEAEFYSVTGAAAAAIGVQSLLADLGVTVHVELHSDASAGIALSIRLGLGRAKHIAVQWLWLQKFVQNKEGKVLKISTKVNTSDLGTKVLDLPRVLFLLQLMGFRKMEGSHPCALKAA